MSKTLKWVLGILAVLVVVAVIVGAVWVWQNRTQMMAGYGPNASQPNFRVTPGAPNGSNYPFGQRGYDNDGNRPMHGWGFRGPGMGGRFFRAGPFRMGFFLLRGLLRLIVPMGLLVLVAFAFYQLGKRSRQVVAMTPRRDSVPSHTTSGEDPSKTG